MNKQFNQKAINQFRKELEAMVDDIKEVDKIILNRAMNEGLRVVKQLTPVGQYKDAKVYKRNNAKKGIKAGDVVKRDGKTVYSNKKAVSFKTNDGKNVSFTAKVSKVGGTLRRSWKITKAKKKGGGVQASLYNNTEYAPYVNYGHRIVNRSGETVGWVKGRFFLEKAIYKIERSMLREFKKEIERVNKEHGR